MSDDRLTDDELEAMRERAESAPKKISVPGPEYNHEGDLECYSSVYEPLHEDLPRLLDEVDRLREEKRELAETLRAAVSDSDLADWVLEITDE
ncbi:MAG: hypothetical protein ABEN55_13485 [Bradymonadaceae bacterium]